MLLADAMFLWMPVDAELHGTDARQGTVIVVERGKTDNPDFPMSAGACDIEWNDAETHGARFELLQHNVSYMIWEHGVSKESVLDALKQVDDINPLQLDLDKKPEGDEYAG